MIFSNDINSIKRYILTALENSELNLKTVMNFEDSAYYGEVDVPVLSISLEKVQTQSMVINTLYSNANREVFASATFNLSLHYPLNYNENDVDDVVMHIYNTLLFDESYDFTQIISSPKELDENLELFLTPIQVKVDFLIQKP